ncbi:MAG: hypothetical protein ACJA0K_001865 [Maricaulis maris]|jgi:hypothetical protein
MSGMTKFCAWIRSLSPLRTPFPSPLGEGARSADEGETPAGTGILPSPSSSFFPEAHSAIRDRRETHRLPDGPVGPGSPPRFCGAAAGRNESEFGMGFDCHP